MEVLNKTKIILTKELLDAGVPKAHIADKLEVDRDTIRVWSKGIDAFGLMGFLGHYEQAKKGPRVKRQVNSVIKRWVWDIREREMDCCGQKIQYFLRKEYDTNLSVPKIYEILSEKYQITSKWKKNQVRGSVPKASKPREVIQMDTVDFGEVFAFTGIDIFTKEVDVVIFPSLTSRDGLVYLETSMHRRFNGHSDIIQTDGGPEFKDEFKNNVLRFTNRHRVARPYKKNEQSYIESFNRSLKGMFRMDKIQKKYRQRTEPESVALSGQISLPPTTHGYWNETTTRKIVVPDIYGNIPANSILLSIL